MVGKDDRVNFDGEPEVTKMVSIVNDHVDKCFNTHIKVGLRP